MSGLRPPPSAEPPARVLLRILVLILLVAVAGLAIWAAVTQQRIDLTEDLTLEDLELETTATADGAILNLVAEGDDPPTLVLLHDADVAGSVAWDGVVSRIAGEIGILRIDLPGFGLSQRFPEEGDDHTVSSMASRVAQVITSESDGAVLIAGVGLGGEVAAEVAVTAPDLVSGLVMVDVDFYAGEGWFEKIEKIPWFGLAVTHALETGGPFAAGRWAPECEEGGWCPTLAQVAARDLAETLEGTSESIQAFRRTPPASLVPSKLNEITVPVRYLWSEQGAVPRESVDRVVEALPEAQVDVVPESTRAHLDSPEVVAAAIAEMASAG